MESDKKGNRENKDSVFKALFSMENNARELYNAVGRLHCRRDAVIAFNTLDDVLFRGRVNDVSFVIDDRLVVLVEQQSSINENMPLRFLLYVSQLYEGIVAEDALSIYRQKLKKIPRPEFICLYNGKDNFPEEKILKLSDAFLDCDTTAPPDLDLTVRVLNINEGSNAHIKSKCKTLSDYVAFYSRIDRNREKGLPLEAAIEEAIKYGIDHGLLEDFLSKYRSEVFRMLKSEFNLELFGETMRIEGREEERINFIFEMLKQRFPDHQIMSLVNITADKLALYKTQLGY